MERERERDDEKREKSDRARRKKIEEEMLSLTSQSFANTLQRGGKETIAQLEPMGASMGAYGQFRHSTSPIRLLRLKEPLTRRTRETQGNS